VYQSPPHWLGGLGTRLWGIESAASAHVRCLRLKASQYGPGLPKLIRAAK